MATKSTDQRWAAYCSNRLCYRIYVKDRSEWERLKAERRSCCWWPTGKPVPLVPMYWADYRRGDRLGLVPIVAPDDWWGPDC